METLLPKFKEQVTVKQDCMNAHTTTLKMEEVEVSLDTSITMNISWVHQSVSSLRNMNLNGGTTNQLQE